MLFLGPSTLDLSFQKAYLSKHFPVSDCSMMSFYAVSALPYYTLFEERHKLINGLAVASFCSFLSASVITNHTATYFLDTGVFVGLHSKEAQFVSKSFRFIGVFLFVYAR